jgi:hypothetical protein
MSELKGDFEQDIPAEMQEDVLTRIVEAAWANDGADASISILEHIEHNVTNIEFNGSIMIDGVEHSFHMRDGNNAGTEIVAWNEDIEIDHTPRPVLALVPDGYRIRNAGTTGAAVKLLDEWNRDLDPATERYAGISKVCSDLAYDLHFDAGLAAGRTHREKAEALGYEVSDSDDAVRIRKSLLMTSFALRPLGAWPAEGRSQALETYEAWSQAKTPGSDIHNLLSRAADRLSKGTGTSPNAEEIAEMKALGFHFTDPYGEYAAWKVGLSGLYQLVDIEGFDPETLPKDPMKELVYALDPSIVEDLRVNPHHEAWRCIDAMASRMTRERSLEMRVSDAESLAVFGFQLVEIETKEPEEGMGMAP